MSAPQHRCRTPKFQITARRLALLASGGIAFQSSCLGRVESGLDLLAAPSAITNALQLPYSSFVEISEFLLRFWF